MFYANAARAWSVYYLYDDDDKPEGWGGNDRSGVSEAMLQAIDYKTGKIRWSHKWPGSGGGVRSGLLSTAGKLLFAGDPSSELRRAGSGDRRAAMARGAACRRHQRPDHV